jgi:uncharacterized radical SAM protein YgiQ
MFIPTTPEELHALGWERSDVILVTGDAYVDSPFIGVAVIGKLLVAEGYRVGIIAQPDIHSARDITRLGEPALFWGVTAGAIDSLVANYTATRRRKRRDDMTPGGRNDRRPDRAAIVYSNLIRQHFHPTAPIVLGGLEASLRRVAHYDFWSDSLRRSILFDAKADLLVYGMGERTVLELAARLSRRRGAFDVRDVQDLRGICYAWPEPPPGALVLPAYAQVLEDKRAFSEMFHTFYRNSDALTGEPLCQQQDTRYLVQNPPALPLSQPELDRIHELDYERDLHPYYARQGAVRALETIRFSITTHRGCYGECNFCSITVHQGRTVTWRSQESLVREAERLTQHPAFRGTILDVGGPSANMYAIECRRKLTQGACPDKRCLYPEVCPALRPDHGPQIALLRALRGIKGVKRVFVASGIRHDLVLADRRAGRKYLAELVRHHISGQLKLAPEHSEAHVLRLMGKPDQGTLLAFRDLFNRLTREAGKEQYLTYYLIAAHPGCTEDDMRRLKRFVSRELALHPEQVQIFTPLPSTYSALMYYTGQDPFTGEPLFVERDPARRERQKASLVAPSAPRRRRSDRGG